MFAKSDPPVATNYFLKPGYIFMPRKPTVISTVVGSCIAVCIFDRKRRCGGMNHFQLPRFPKDESPTARYGDVSTLTLIRMMLTGGTEAKHLEAQIFGGAHNPKLSKQNIGRENIMIARKILSSKGIKIVSEDVGGELGRKIVFNTEKNEVGVLKVEKLRQEDWFPYESNR